MKENEMQDNRASEKKRDTIAKRTEGERGWKYGKRTERNIALTQTMRSLEGSFQGLRKAYNPVYRPRKSVDIYSTAFVAHPSTLLHRSSFSPSLLSLRTHRHPPLMCRETLGGALIPFHFTSAFYERALQDRSRRYASFGNERVAFRPHTSSVPKSDVQD